MIEFENVTRRYGRKLAVDGLSLNVRAGEVFALLGPNGAGKTTAIRMLVGLLRPDAGGVRVCGCDVASRTRHAALCLGYVPEEAFLYDKLSGREFLEFAGEMRGLGAADVRERIARETERFVLAEFLDHLIETYSHGMKQRLVFASALLHDPTVLVIDEPMVGLDPRSMRVVKDLLQSQARQGRTVFMSTHTLAVAEEIADRIGVLNSGHLRFLGTLAELRQEMAAPQAALEPLFLELTSGNHRAGS
jgi:ABC-2 type transport system ATP-binding protein